MVEKMTGTIDAPFRLGYLDDKKSCSLERLKLKQFLVVSRFDRM